MLKPTSWTSPPPFPPLEDCGYRLESEVRERHGAPSRRSGRLAASLGCDVAGQSWRENVCVCVLKRRFQHRRHRRRLQRHASAAALIIQGQSTSVNTVRGGSR